MPLTHVETLRAEAASWILGDPARQEEKLRRERIRHHKMARDLLLDRLGTEEMDVLEIGGGPLPLSDCLRFRSRIVVDPLADAYRAIAACPDHIAARAEDFPAEPRFDLVICTNALDHVDQPVAVMRKMPLWLRPGGYAAILCAENNAITHPHPAHAHNLVAATVHLLLDREFETVWELNYRDHGFRYGHVLYEGKRGQPAFALLLRRCSGYS